MVSVNIAQAKSHLSSLVSGMQHSGEPVIICRHGKAIAELIPLRRGGRTRPDKRLLRIKIKQDPTLPTTSEWEDA